MLLKSPKERRVLYASNTPAPKTADGMSVAQAMTVTIAVVIVDVVLMSCMLLLLRC